MLSLTLLLCIFAFEKVHLLSMLSAFSQPQSTTTGTMLSLTLLLCIFAFEKVHLFAIVSAFSQPQSQTTGKTRGFWRFVQMQLSMMSAVFLPPFPLCSLCQARMLRDHHRSFL